MHEMGFNFDDVRIMRGAWRNEPNPDLCKVDNVVQTKLLAPGH